MAKVQLAGLKCERCDHQWLPRDPTSTPRVCPKCKSPYWDRARRVIAAAPAAKKYAAKSPRSTGSLIKRRRSDG
jgi:hypothetical protein